MIIKELEFIIFSTKLDIDITYMVKRLLRDKNFIKNLSYDFDSFGYYSDLEIVD